MTTNIFDMADTWNAIGTTFNGIKMNFTDGAGGAPVGAAASRFFRLDSNGSQRFTVDAAGTLRIHNESAATDWASFLWFANEIYFLTENSGGVNRNINIRPGTGASLTLGSDGGSKWQIPTTGHLLSATDNIYDIGASGATRPRSGYFGTNLTVGATSSYLFASSGGLKGSADGVFALLDTAGTSFGRLQFGGTTSSFPALKRSSAALQVRLADDTDYAQIISKGTTTNDNAAAGNLGEIIESEILVGSAVALTTNTSANVTSISLTAGDWDVWGNVWYTPAATTSITIHQGAINTVSATLPTAPGAGAFYKVVEAALVPNAIFGESVGQRRLSLSATTTVYLVAQATFTISTLSAYGYIGARRVR